MQQATGAHHPSLCTAILLCLAVLRGNIRSVPQKTATLYKLYCSNLSMTNLSELCSHLACLPICWASDALRVRQLCLQCDVISFTMAHFCSLAFLQWLVFRRDGSETAAAWAQKAAEATASNTSIGDGEFMDFFEPQRRLQRRQAFVCSILRQTMQVHMQGLPLCLSNSHATFEIKSCMAIGQPTHGFSFSAFFLLMQTSCQATVTTNCFLLHHWVTFVDAGRMLVEKWLHVKQLLLWSCSSHRPAFEVIQ